MCINNEITENYNNIYNLFSQARFSTNERNTFTKTKTTDDRWLTNKCSRRGILNVMQILRQNPETAVSSGFVQCQLNFLSIVLSGFVSVGLLYSIKSSKGLLLTLQKS